MVKAPVVLHSPDQEQPYQPLITNKKLTRDRIQMAAEIKTPQTINNNSSTATSSPPPLSAAAVQSQSAVIVEPTPTTVAPTFTPTSAAAAAAPAKVTTITTTVECSPLTTEVATVTTKITPVTAITTTTTPSANTITSTLCSNSGVVNVISHTSPPTTAIAVVAPTARGNNNTIINHQQQVPMKHMAAAINSNGPPGHVHPPRIPHHFHHLAPFPVPPPGGGGPWPIVEPVFHFGPGFEPQTRPYCPTHSQGQHPSEHVVLFHVNPGVSVTFQVAGNREVVRGPVTVPMVSQSNTPPMAMPVQVPPGHVMQQIVDESGTLRHVILSTAQHQQLQGGVGVQSVQPHLTHYINGQAPHFFQPLPAAYPGPGPGPHYHPIPGGHMPPHQQMTHSPHSPSPPTNNYHKDERTQRQHTKLLRKLDQKRDNNNSSAMSTPAHSPSPRKGGVVEMNGGRTPRNGASSVGTSEDGEESSSVPDEDDDQLIIEQLSDVQSPEISEITSRSALVQWSAPPVSCDNNKSLNSRDFRYEVLLSDRGKEGKYKSIFKGASLSCLIQDLKPAQEYYVCLQVYLELLQGSASEAAVFTTPACEPDTPQVPKLIARSKNSLLMRWNAPADNGGHIQHYLLEHNDGKGKEFIETIKTKAKQYSLSKLQPSTTYNFRLAAVNEHGKSGYSDEFTFATSGNPPMQPKSPSLQTVSSSTLRLAWMVRECDDEFVLQMNDRETGHGYLPVYHGRDNFYECVGLRRATVFHFRLRADNENGTSPWSDEISFKTLPERPARPLKPQVKGKIHATNFKAKWEPPADRGGAEIQVYHLDISSGATFERIYSGIESEVVCDRLQPGTTYQVRVMCEGPGGLSLFSEPLTVTTEAIVPGQPAPPYCVNPPAPYAAVLKWEYPDYNGGAPVIEYEIEVEGGVPTTRRQAYRGKETLCVLKDLLPGEEYKVQLRALNRIGAGAWSEEYTFRAGAAAPNKPESLQAAIKTPTHMLVSWKEPHNNGAEITEYRLENSTAASTDEQFATVYQGSQTATDLKHLTPFTTYHLRVCAANLAGISPFSETLSIRTPAAVPCPPTIDSFEISANDILLIWNAPESNGAEILHYNIEYGDKLISTEANVTEFLLKNLEPEHLYKIKVQAVNAIGAGLFSSVVKVTTLPLPPRPPRLECFGYGCNFLKLKWGEKLNPKTMDFSKKYTLEVYSNRMKEFQKIYSGTSLTFKVNKLQEMTAYTFRICAETEYAGVGDYSEEVVFKTTATQPANIKAPRLVENATITIPNSSVDGSGGELVSPSATAITVEWQHSKNAFADSIEYVLQLSKTKKEDFKEIYRGPETRYTIENLTPGVEYQMKVCPIRILANGDNLMGIFSPVLRHTINLDAGGFDSVDGHHINHHNHRLNSNFGGVTLVHGSGGGVGGNLSLVNSMGGTASGSFGGVVARGGPIGRVVSRISSIYKSRDKWTDQNKALIYAFVFVLITCIFAAIVNNFVR